MNKLSIILLTLSLSLAGNTTNRLSSLINEFRLCPDVEIVSLGRLGTSAIKSLVKISSGNEDSEEFLDIVRDVKKVAVIDFESCNTRDKDKFRSKAENVLENLEIIMEIKDEGDNFTIYGIVDENASAVKDFVMYSRDDCALICLFGSISMDSLSNMLAQ